MTVHYCLSDPRHFEPKLQLSWHQCDLSLGLTHLILLRLRAKVSSPSLFFHFIRWPGLQRKQAEQRRPGFPRHAHFLLTQKPPPKRTHPKHFLTFIVTWLIIAKTGWCTEGSWDIRSVVPFSQAFPGGAVSSFALRSFANSWTPFFWKTGQVDSA